MRFGYVIPCAGVDGPSDGPTLRGVGLDAWGCAEFPARGSVVIASQVIAAPDETVDEVRLSCQVLDTELAPVFDEVRGVTATGLRASEIAPPGWETKAVLPPLPLVIPADKAGVYTAQFTLNGDPTTQVMVPFLFWQR